MSDGFDLGSYLAEARAGGEHTSEGSFTIAQDKALDKLAHFSLAGSYDWALKVVQAVNAWNCRSLQVSQTRVATSFFFEPPDAEFPSDSQIVGALRHGSFESDGAIHELCLALRALVDQAKLSFVLTTRQNGELGEPIYSGDDVSALSERVRKKWAALHRDGIRLTVSHFKSNESFTGRYIPTIANVRRRDMQIADILERRAYCSPAPVYLDGRNITNPFLHRKVGGNLYSRPVGFGHQPSSEDEPWVFQPYPALLNYRYLKRPTALRQKGLSWFIIRTWDWLTLEEVRLADTSVYSDYLPEKSNNHLVHWTRHGVICNTERLFNGTQGTSLFAIIPSDDVPSDLTGLAVRTKDSILKERYKAVVTEIKVCLQQLETQQGFLASKIAHESILPFQPQADEEDLQRLDAGFSIFTEGLFSGESALGTLKKQLHQGWRMLKGLPYRETMVLRWSEFVCREAQRLLVDLRGDRGSTGSRVR